MNFSDFLTSGSAPATGSDSPGGSPSPGGADNRGGSSAGAVRVLSAALLLTTVGAGILYASLRRTHDQAAAIEPLARRAQLRDALMGKVVPLEVELRRAGAERPVEAPGVEALLPAGEEGLLWVVDPAHCVGCLEAAGEWRRVARTLGPRAALVLHGVAPERAEFLVRRVGLPGRVLADPDGRVMAALGVGRRPGTAVLTTDDAGEVVTAAIRDEYRSCSWSPLRRALRLMQGKSRGSRAGAPTTRTGRVAEAGG